MNLPEISTSFFFFGSVLTYFTALSQLLPHALPTLTDFKLQVPFTPRFASSSRELLSRSTSFSPTVLHLCPLVRRFSKNIKRLSLALPYICRDMFIDDSENAALLKVGVPGNAVG